MKDEVLNIMLEHLKMLKKDAEDCDEKLLQPITNAMVMTACYITSQFKEEKETQEN